jgi:hypothetical protein
MLRNVDEYGMVVGMMKNTVDLVVTNVKAGLASQCSTVRWGFFLPLSDAIKEITALVEQDKVGALACLLFYKEVCVCVCVRARARACVRVRERGEGVKRSQIDRDWYPVFDSSQLGVYGP